MHNTDQPWGRTGEVVSSSSGTSTSSTLHCLDGRTREFVTEFAEVRLGDILTFDHGIPVDWFRNATHQILRRNGEPVTAQFDSGGSPKIPQRLVSEFSPGADTCCTVV